MRGRGTYLVPWRTAVATEGVSQIVCVLPMLGRRTYFWPWRSLRHFFYDLLERLIAWFWRGGRRAGRNEGVRLLFLPAKREERGGFRCRALLLV